MKSMPSEEKKERTEIRRAKRKYAQKKWYGRFAESTENELFADRMPEQLKYSHNLEVRNSFSRGTGGGFLGIARGHFPFFLSRRGLRFFFSRQSTSKTH